MGDLEKKYYYIEEIIETIEGEGVHTGIPVIIVRFLYPVEYGEQLKLKPVQGKIGRWTSLEAIVDICKKSSIKTVHLMGEDPAFQAITPLAEALHGIGKSLFIDSNGMAWFNPHLFSFISIGPKPYQPIDPLLEASADEFRLYYSEIRQKEWLEVITHVLRRTSEHSRGVIYSVLPRRIPEDIPAVFGLVKASTLLRASLPTYRLYPDIDKSARRLL